MSATSNVPTYTLADLKTGHVAIVDSIAREDALGIRLQELGFVPGTAIKLVRRAPLGDPLEFQLRGYHVSLRAEEARSIRTRIEGK